ncbi:MAG TPA: TraR/DksA C4-type zinc finger protein [Thermoleophilaceae bacterium]|nr:TraR/DksA C4-type zinc finger protein [Thermoleophilaceae bacterium]
MTEGDRERVESRLQARLDEIARTRAAVRRSSEGMRDSELAHVDNHPGDTASELHDEELDETTAIMLEEEERRIEEARRALADGSYGTCKSCGREIPLERLEAVPEAVLCVDCQRHFEGLHRQRTRV